MAIYTPGTNDGRQPIYLGLQATLRFSLEASYDGRKGLYIEQGNDIVYLTPALLDRLKSELLEWP